MLKRLSMYGRNLLMTIALKATEHYISVVLSIIPYTVFLTFLVSRWKPTERPLFQSNWALISLACEQALLGDLAAGREKEGELATTSLEFEFPRRKSRCEMLIGGDDISNDAITTGTGFSTFVYIRPRFHFALIAGNLTAQSTGSHRGIGGGIQIPET